MLYDANGRIIKDNNAEGRTLPAAGAFLVQERSDRYERDVSRGLTPVDVDRIMTAANCGDIAEQCQLCTEIQEKSEFVSSVLPVRVQAVLGLPYEIKPGDETPAAKKAAEYFAKELKKSGRALDTFKQLREDLLTHLLPGIGCSEIIWAAGGRIDGFKFVEARHLTLRDGYDLKLVTRNEPLGVPLEPNKFIVHKYRRNGGDVARGGLIRPLAWLHCFANLTLKDLLRFIERYGMPFTVAKVDKNTWDNERDVVQRLIRGFGPDGGAVLPRESEIELLAAANNTGDVYFKLLDYLDKAITRIVLGQTATSGDASGWSKGSAQGQVRQDILEYDAGSLDDTLNSQLAEPWAAFNFPGVAAPQIVTDATPPEDITALAAAQKVNAEKIQIAVNAGYEPIDDDEVSGQIGVKVKKKVPQASSLQDPGITGRDARGTLPDAVALAADSPTSPTIQTALAAWLGPLAAAAGELADQDNPGIFGQQLAALSAPDKLGKFDDQAMIDLLAANAAKAATDGFKTGQTRPTGQKDLTK